MLSADIKKKKRERYVTNFLYLYRNPHIAET